MFTITEVHPCPTCGELTAGGMDDHCMSCGWRPAPTVREVATVTVDQPVDGRKNRRPRRKQKAGPKHPVSHIKVDPRVWKRARGILAEGRYSRIEVIDSETVVVR